VLHRVVLPQLARSIACDDPGHSFAAGTKVWRIKIIFSGMPAPRLANQFAST
jgi:hypothetical protein